MIHSFIRAGKAIAATLHKRAFLMRLLASTLLASFIPLFIISARFISVETDSVRDLAQRELDHIASATANSFEEIITSINTVNTKIQSLPKLKENVISSAVSSEMEAIDILKYLSSALPSVRVFGIYDSARDVMYSNSGKFRQDGLCNQYLGIPQMEFDRLLAEYVSPGFVPWESTPGSMIFISRADTNALSRRYTIYVIPPAFLISAMSTSLGERAAVSAIYDKSGALIYQDKSQPPSAADDSLIYARVSTTHGFHIQLCMDKSAYQKNIEVITSNVRALSLLSIMLCAVLIVIVALWNYRPLSKVVERIRDTSQHERTSELTIIMDSYSDLSEQTSTLAHQLNEKDMLLIDRIMDNILSGRNVPDEDLNRIKLEMPFYRVACMQVSDAGNLSEILRRNSIGGPIYAIEMYADGVLAFVCGLTDAGETSYKNLSATLRAKTDRTAAPIGFSNAYTTPGQLFLAYVEALRALFADDCEPDRLAGPPLNKNFSALNHEAKVVERLTVALKNADEYMLQFADESFQRIFSQSASPDAQRYACYQLIELYRGLGEAVGLVLPMEQLASILSRGGPSELREQFLALLTSLREARLEQLSHAKQITASDVIAFVSENFANPLFSMNDVAEHLDVSIYTAGRILQKLTGITFRKYLNDMRVEYAKDLLVGTNLSVNEIAVRAGFSSPSYFVRIFRETEATTPGKYRAEIT